MNINPPENVIEICCMLNAVGFEAYLVGGAVRDSIMGREPSDWDIATNALPDEVARRFSRVIETGIQHGTVTVILDGESYEVTTYRVDGDYSDGRHPDSVRFTSNILTDLERRDFTMNAIAYNPLTGGIIDPCHGVDDIHTKTVRAVGCPNERFNEDTLRALRAVRFAAVLGFDIEQLTFNAIALCDLSVSAERIRVELVKGLLSDMPSLFLTLLLESGLLHQVLPEMLPMVDCTQNKYHQFDVWEHTLVVTDGTPADTCLRLAGMLHDVAKPTTKGTNPVTGESTFYEHEKVGADMVDAIMRRLKFSNEDRERVVHLVHHHLVPELKSPSAMRRWVRRVGIENVSNLIALAQADCIGKGMPRCIGTSMAYLDELSTRIATMRTESTIVTSATQLAVDGNDIMSALGIGPGKAVGDKLRELIELVTDDPSLNERDTLLAIVATGKQ